jgi:hypothetical protein
VQGAGLKPAATLFLAGALAALICACGGGGGSEGAAASQTTGKAKASKTASQATGKAEAEGQTLPGHPKIAAKPAPGPGGSRAQGNRYGNFTRAGAAAAERRAARRQRGAHRRLARKAGNAAPFLVPVGDNSIPTYGSQGSAAQQSEAEAALSSYLQARAAGEWSSACAQMAATVQKQLALLSGATQANSASCADAYAKLSERVTASQRVSPLSGGLAALRVKGDKAFALFYGPHEQQYMMPMVSEEGAWKVNQIEPIPWPIGAPPAGN